LAGVNKAKVTAEDFIDFRVANPMNAAAMEAQKNYSMVKVLRIISKHGTAEHWANNDLDMDELGRLKLAEASWKIEEYHRGLKQVTDVEGCQCRKAQAKRSHIGLALRAFLIFERYCFRTGYNWVGIKAKIFQDAVRAFRANPWIGRYPANA
jgi:putative transposase